MRKRNRLLRFGVRVDCMHWAFHYDSQNVRCLHLFPSKSQTDSLLKQLCFSLDVAHSEGVLKFI